MTLEPAACRPKWRQGTSAIVLLSRATLTIALGLAAGVVGGYRVNLTSSEPLGLWRIVDLGRPVMVGDLVFICPPQTPVMQAARKRGYLRAGLCPGRVAPLIKTVVAIADQRVDIGADVSVDGFLVARSKLAERDGKGRPLMPFAGGIVPEGMVFLHSAFPGSYDSRYFGPLPASGILGRAEKVLTYAP